MIAATLMLAALTSPALFMGGAAAVAVPIIIHLLARRRFKRVRWAAMDFLIDAEKRNRRRIRLEELILLALRCLAILLIALVVARPFVRPTGVAAILGGSERTERVFLLDDSFSMGYLTDGKSTFDRARTSVANLVGRLREHAPGDTVTILRTSDVDTPVVVGALLDDKQIERILARLEALSPTQNALSIDACLTGLAKVLENDAEIHSAAVYVVSDFQRVDWVGSPAAAPNSDRVAALRQWVDDQRALRMILVDVGDDAAKNLAVTDLRSTRRQLVTGVEAPLEAQVSNFAAADVEGVELAVITGQAPQASARLEHVPAGGSAVATVRTNFERPGDATVRVEIAPDNLPVDNARNLAVEVSEAIRVLLVNGEPSGDAYLDEVHLLASALHPAGEVSSGNQVEIIEEASLDGAAFDAYHLVVLCNLYRVSEPVAEALHRYVSAGGGLAVFLGDQVTDPAIYNAVLYRDGEGLLPAALRSVVRAPDIGATLAAGDFLHPVVAVFSGRDNPFLQRVLFRQYYATEPAMSSLDSPGAGAEEQTFRPAANVLAQFDDRDMTPAIIERPYGRGRVMLFTSSCDQEWNDWPKDPSYVVAMLEIAQHLARSRSTDRDLRVGDMLTLNLDPSAFDINVTLRPPGFPQVGEEELTATATPDGGMSVVWPHTDQAGVYTLNLRQRDGMEVVRKYCVNLDENESDLAPAMEAELRQACGDLPVEYIAGVATSSDDADEGRTELWPLCLAWAMGVLMIEQLLAWWFGRS